MTESYANLSQSLSQLKDHRRQNRNIRHEFIDILIIALCGMLSGADDWVAIEAFGKEKISWLKRFLSLPNGIPSHDTFARLFAQIDPDAFLDTFIHWVNTQRTYHDKEIIAVDGKTLRRSHDRKNGQSAIHMVSAWASENGLVLGQRSVDEKSNEITAIPELLDTLVLDNCLITIDAMGCQTAIADKIIAKNADYLLAVKDNQSVLKAGIEATLSNRKPKPYQCPEIDFHQCEGSNRDRYEVRRCWTTQSLTQLANAEKWPSLKTIALVETERRHHGESVIERRYYISSDTLSALACSDSVRKHWSIENSLHWVLDIAFREDDCRVRSGNGAENLSRLRQFALNLLKQDKSTKIGLKNKRMKAAWSTDYLAQLIGIELPDL
uniref:Transposase IS4 family protein n=1 Tax=gamma proteobacterium D250 TaxID=649546 RepID=M4HWZ0_9GAMM|nr:transposase IS4 family protein [gamma proteobacterium D250]